jgi:hypothetical protein
MTLDRVEDRVRERQYLEVALLHVGGRQTLPRDG